MYIYSNALETIGYVLPTDRDKAHQNQQVYSEIRERYTTYGKLFRGIECNHALHLLGVPYPEKGLKLGSDMVYPVCSSWLTSVDATFTHSLDRIGRYKVLSPFYESSVVFAGFLVPEEHFESLLEQEEGQQIVASYADEGEAMIRGVFGYSNEQYTTPIPLRLTRDLYELGNPIQYFKVAARQIQESGTLGRRELGGSVAVVVQMLINIHFTDESLPTSAGEVTQKLVE